MTPTKLAKGFRCFICLKAKAQQHNSERLIRFSNFRQHARSSWPIGPKKYQSFDSDVTNSKANHTISFSNLSCLNIVKKRMGAGAHLQINLEINLENRILDINNATPTWYLSKKCFGIIKYVSSSLDLEETVSSNVGLKGSNLQFIKLIGKLTHHGLPSYNHNRNNYNRNTI